MNTRRVPEMTADELEIIIRKAVRDELNASGLRIDEPDHQQEAREDFRFLRRFRKAFDGAASKIGGTLLVALISGIAWLFWQGAQTLWGPK